MNTIGERRAIAADTGGTRRMRTRLWAAVTTALALSIGALTVPVTAAVAETAPAPGTPQTVTADALPTVQIDGVVYAQEVVGNTVYVGGSFSKARPAGAAPGTNETTRANLLAYDLTTGELITSWNPGANNTVLDIKKSADGSRIYVAGMFSKAADAWRYRVAAFDTATGALVTDWAPAANGRIDSVAVTESAVYLAGEFTSINGTQRLKTAAVSTVNGAVTPFSANVQGGYGARSIVVSPDRSKVVIAGSFTSVNGSTNPGRGITALDANTGKTMPWAMNGVLRNAGTPAAMYSLTSDGDSVYGTGFHYGATAEDFFEGVFRASWTDGRLIWMEDCHGDSYDTAVTPDTVYVVGHPHDCSTVGGWSETAPQTIRHSLAFAREPSDRLIEKTVRTEYRSFAGQPSGTLLNWYPEYVPGKYTGQSQGPWQITASGDYLLVGGEFLKVNGTAQQGLVRYAKKTVAPNKQGPRVQGDAWVLDAVPLGTGATRLSWLANHDIDNQSLTYRILRQDDRGNTVPIHEVDQLSTFWNRPAMTFRDITAAAGTAYRYRVTATDASGNSTQSGWASARTGDAGTIGAAYTAAVLDSTPVSFWPLNEAQGSAGVDWIASNDLRLTGATRGATGPTSPHTATRFDGATTTGASSTAATTAPQTFTVEAWFQTSSTAGGKIVGFGNLASGLSPIYDRHIYLDGSGRVTFGVFQGAPRAITSGAGFNDGKWHHVSASLSAAGQVLYVDGIKVGEQTGVTSAHPYSGYWRVGGDQVGGWPSSAGSPFAGSIANVAIYDRALSVGEVDAHRVAAGATSRVPSDAYGRSVFDLDPTLYWRLDETGTGTAAADSGQRGSAGTYSGGADAFVRGEKSAIVGSTGSAVRSAPATASSVRRITGNTKHTNPGVVSVETWFSSASSLGGTIVGFGDSQNQYSSQYDRRLYMTPDGRLNFGVYNKGLVVLTTSAALNDGKWHHAVGQLSSAGMALYVDGALIATNTNTVASPFDGYWRVGSESPWSGAALTFTGSIDEVAVYGKPLTAAQVAEHYDLGTRAVNKAPVAGFAAAPTDLSVVFDAATSADPDGSIASYEWDFGDGVHGSGVQSTHTYAAAGTYDVTLTVTDAGGATASVTKKVAVAAPPVTTPPVTTPPTPPLVADTFTRTVPAGGWGSADLGGAWTFQGGSASYSVSGTAGLVSMAPSQTRTARLGLSATDAVIRVSVAADQVSTGGAATATVIGRQVAGSNYSARVRFEVGGGVRLYLLRDETALGSYLMPGVTYTPGTVLNVALSVTGTNPTTLSAKVWKATDVEPATWQVTATDTTAAMQVAGTVGLMNTVSGASTLPATVFTWDDLTITTP